MADLEMAFGVPHEEAAAFIRGKPAVSRKVFDGLLPELRGRAFTISGVEGAKVLQRVRDGIAGLPLGATWDEVKGGLVEELDTYLGDGAEARAELLLRTHGFQAFQASNWRVIQEDEDTTHMQYLATEDDRVRDSHLALNGLVLKKNDSFWDDHYPPWEWNCRCRVRPMNPDLVAEEKQADEDRPPEDRNVVDGAVLKQLREGTLIRGGRRYDVTAPKDGPDGASAFQWSPDNLRLDVKGLEERYDAETWGDFRKWAQNTVIEGTGKTVWVWLTEKQNF